MKKLGLLILFFFLFISFGLKAQELNNAGFENWTDGNPDYWTLNDEGPDCVFSQVAGEEGYALRAEVITNGSGFDGEFSQIVLDIVEGQSFDFSIRVKGTNNVTNALRFWCTWMNASDVNLPSSNVQPSTYYSTTTNWTTYSIIGAIAPPTAVKVKWGIRLYGLQTTDFDFGGNLPVELTSFSATKIGKDIKLTWSTSTEINNFGFEIERSVFKGEWNKIGFVNGNGNSNSPKNYSFVDDKTSTGRYSYRLKQIDNDGQFEYSKVIEIDVSGVKEYELTQNYPNPFNPTTTIQYILPQTGMVRLTLYNVLGEEIRTLVNEIKDAGTHTVNINADNLNSGIYIYRIESGSFVQSRKMTIIK